MGWHFLLQGSSQSRRPNLCLPHWKEASLRLSHQGSPEGYVCGCNYLRDLWVSQGFSTLINRHCASTEPRRFQFQIYHPKAEGANPSDSWPNYPREIVWSMNSWFDDSQRMVPGPAALASPENLLEMQILVPHPRPTESEFCKWGPERWASISTSGDSEAHSNLRTTVSVWMP